ncbi:MAG: hypothetical protein HDS84_04700 [Bacteroidales bacterium]|nr:hypothetical protein [Bacteroidales bacterium]
MEVYNFCVEGVLGQVISKFAQTWHATSLHSSGNETVFAQFRLLCSLRAGAAEAR